MNLFAKLSISLILAVAATAAIHFLSLTGPIQIGLAIAAVCILAALIGNAGAGQAVSPAPTAKPSDRPPPTTSSEGERERGTVKWFNVSKGFGFIIRENGEEIFVHFRSIISEDKSRRGLKDGQEVSYVVVESDKGPQAEDVEAL